LRDDFLLPRVWHLPARADLTIPFGLWNGLRLVQSWSAVAPGWLSG
jgi:hypothetical protein